MKNLFFNIETTIKIKLGSILEKLTQRHNRREQAYFDYCDNEICTSTQFLQIQKKLLIDLQEHLERYCNVLPIFGFNNAKYDLNLIKSYLLPIPVNERNIEPTVTEKANQFISFKFGNIQLLDIMNFLGGATSLDSFLKAYKTSETKRFFPYEWLDQHDKMQNRELPPYDAFYSKLRSCNPLETEYTENVNLLKNGLTTEQAVIKSTDAKIYPVTEGDKDLLGKNREDVVVGPSIVFTRKAVVDETFIRKSTNICKSIVGIDASQLYHYSKCQPMPTGFYTRWDIDSETGRFTPRQNKTRSFENMVMSYFQRTRPDCKIESFYTTGRQKKIDRFSVDGF